MCIRDSTNTGMKTGGMTDLTTLMDVKKIKKYAKAVQMCIRDRSCPCAGTAMK